MAWVKAGELVQLLTIDLLSALIGRIEGEVSAHTFAQGAIVAVEHADRDDRTRASVSYKVRELRHQLHAGRRRSEEDFAGPCLVHAAKGVENVRFEHRAFAFKDDAAPGTDRETTLRRG